jgi:hypothetical protein
MGTGFNQSTVLRFVAAAVLAWVTSSVVLSGGFALLKASWPDYALAAPDKAYTLTMLFVRLFIFSTMIAATSAVATFVARDGRFAWIAGGLILAVSIPPHLYPAYVWDDYPAWYHIVYLISILPIGVVAGRSVQRLYPPATLAESAV